MCIFQCSTFKRFMTFSNFSSKKRKFIHKQTNRLQCNRNFSNKPKLDSFSKEDEAEFMSYFPVVVKHLTEEQHLEDAQDITKRFSECLNYTVPTGKRVRGLTTVISYKYLVKPENLTPENIKIANILGWCAELVEAALLIYDDIMDDSITRRNNICWHRKEGLVAVTDALALNISCYILMKKYIHSHPFYIDMVDFTHKIIWYTTLGQTMDSIKHTPKDMSVENYKRIIKYKTGYYTFYYPAILGMYLSKNYNEEIHNKVTPILFALGEFFQINNDIHDCFADVTVTGKQGTDIEESKCTWLAARALEKCSISQKKNFEQNYGKPDKEAVENIKNLYLELNVLDEYFHFENEFFTSVLTRANSLANPHKELMVVLIKKLRDLKSKHDKNLSHYVK